MARINIDEEFWSDQRFDYFSHLIGSQNLSEITQNQWLSRYRILLLWKFCYNKRTSRLSETQIVYSCNWTDDPKNLIAALIEADIISRDGDEYFVHGIDKRIAYLTAQKERGKLGGRPSKNQMVKEEKPNALKSKRSAKPNALKSKSLPLALSLAPALALSPALAQEGNPPNPPSEGGSPAEDLPPEKITAHSQAENAQEENADNDELTAIRLGELWNLAISDCALNWVPVKIESLRKGSKRDAAARSRIREYPDMGYWIETLKRLIDSKFANGENDRGWRADFDFFIRPDTHIKINEGKYDNKP